MAIISPKAVFLDFDGTLADSMPIMKKCYQNFLYGLNKVPTDKEFESLNGPPLLEVVTKLKANHQLGLSVDNLINNYKQLIVELYNSVQPIDGAIDFLLSCERNHCTIAIVTSNLRPIIQSWLRRSELEHLIGFIIAGEDLPLGKPNPAPYLLAKKKVECKEHQMVAIEDSNQGVSAALAAGLTTFHLTNESANLAGMRESHDQSAVKVSSFKELIEIFW